VIGLETDFATGLVFQTATDLECAIAVDFEIVTVRVIGLVFVTAIGFEIVTVLVIGLEFGIAVDFEIVIVLVTGLEFAIGFETEIETGPDFATAIGFETVNHLKLGSNKHEFRSLHILGEHSAAFRDIPNPYSRHT